MAATDDAAAKYGQIGAMVQAIPELRSIFDQAVTEEWTPDRFVLAVQNTEWWKTHGETARAVINKQATDPASYEQDLASGADRVSRMANQLGYGSDLDPYNRDIAANAMLYGWSDDEIAEQIVRRLPQNGNGGGARSEMIARLTKTAADYGVPQTQQGIGAWVDSVLVGANTEQGFVDVMKGSAMSTYPGFADQIAAGATVRQLADPYVATLSNLWEVAPDSIDFSKETLVKQAMQGTGTQVAGTGAAAAPVATPLWKFEQQAKQDPRWGVTANARNEVDSIANRIGRDFGFLS